MIRKTIIILFSGALLTCCQKKTPIQIQFPYFIENNIKLNSTIDSVSLRVEDISDYSQIENTEKLFYSKNYYGVDNDSVLVESIFLTSNGYIKRINSKFQTLDSLKIDKIKKELLNKYMMKISISPSKSVLESVEFLDENVKIEALEFKDHLSVIAEKRVVYQLSPGR